MTQIILDDNLNLRAVLGPIQKWIAAQRLHNLRPGEQILDDRIPEILRTLKQPTFVTIDHGFWHKDLCHPGYAILYFALRDTEQELLPGLLRALLRRPQFHNRASRMGKVARVGTTRVDYWEFQRWQLQQLVWPATRRKKT